LSVKVHRWNGAGIEGIATAEGSIMRVIYFQPEMQARGLVQALLFGVASVSVFVEPGLPGSGDPRPLGYSSSRTTADWRIAQGTHPGLGSGGGSGTHPRPDDNGGSGTHPRPDDKGGSGGGSGTHPPKPDDK
jgi:hypothetical protein